MLNKCLAVLVLAAGLAAAADKPPSDAAIADTGLIRLSADREVNGGALKVDVKGGVVTISGVLETQRQKDKVPKIARKVKGVKQVINNVTLKERTAGK